MNTHSRASVLEQDQFEEVPTVQPRLAEFLDTWTYLLSLREIGQHHGAVRIVPPTGWRARGDDGYESADALLRCFGQQHSDGELGVYVLTTEEGSGTFLSDFRRVIARDEEEDPRVAAADPRAVEREFWRTLGLGVGPVYSGFSPNGSLF
eukprot:CAMPEP_0172209170 /NCGR_PEP_ID=MMETSP1050-20130122/34942_1 /TAXON_ID=233186 /ORGANISM="Cryptomonas curvata, Strain CCAP979/52" /LENGTH=149 /DNA_ID=CAMNT_0012888969 /DNA_START=156 /DNA_END=602 /DNA_ORIENTATION=-